MKRHKTFFLLAYTALLTTSLVALSQGRESRVMGILHREAREAKVLLRQSSLAAQSHVKLIEALYLQANEPEASKDI